MKEKTETIKRALVFILCCLYWSLMILIANALYQTYKDFYYNVACIGMMLILMLIKKDFRISRLAIIPAIAVSLFAINYMYDTRHDWGNHLRMVLFTRHILYAVIVFFLLSLLFNRAKILEWKQSVNGIVCALFIIGAAVLEYKEAFKVLFPFLFVLCIGKLSKDEIKKLMNRVAASMYTTFFVFMTWSLLTHPERSEVGRYEGIFNFPIVTGLVSSLGVISSLHFIYEVRENKNDGPVYKRVIVRCVPLLMLAYAVVMLISSTNRASLLGMVLIALMYIGYFIAKTKKATKSIILVILMVFTIGGALGFNWMAHNFYPVEFAEEHNISEDSVLYYFIVHLPAVCDHSYTAVFEPGTVGNTLDRMSSDRLGIWVAGLRQVTLFGKNPTEVLLPDGCIVGHVHSTLIDWLMRYGALCGSIGLIWIVCSAGNSFYYFFVKKEKWILSFFWTVFSIGVFMVEKQCWAELLPMTLILFQYRFFYDIDNVEARDELALNCE